MAETTPDLTKAPKFDALRDWIDKLDEWCEQAVKEIHGLKLDLARSRSANEELERAGNEQYQGLVDVIRDVERGVSDFPELMSKLPSIHTEGAE